jgi:hypothetical protein
MNRALFYLWLALLRRRSLRFIYSLRRPTSLLGALAVFSLLGVLFYFRNYKWMADVMRNENLIGAALVMLCGSVFKGFLQRGLVCEPADIEFVFTSPFTERQVVFYRLLPNYLFAIVQALVFCALFASHFHYPLLVTFCLILFQIACFHLATAAAIFSGTISEQVHYRLRWMMLALFFLIAALYLRMAWNFKIIPAIFSSPLFQLFFYPAVALPDSVNILALHRWALKLQMTDTINLQQLWRNTLYVAGFGLLAISSLWLLLKFKVSPFEAALGATTRVAADRQRVQQGSRAVAAIAPQNRSVALPRLALFHGAGAIVWKNLVAFRRCRREMLLASFFVLTYTGFFTALLWIFNDLAKKAGGAPLVEARGFTSGIALFLGMLAFFLQRMFPFDFRRDGEHLLNFRTLPISPMALSLAEVAVPTMLCLAAQTCGVVPMIILGHFDWPTLVFVVLGYPAVSLALNSVWNIHYLMAATRRLSGHASSSTAVGMVLVVALSFLVFYPAGWTTIAVAKHFPTQNESWAFSLATGVGLGIQYGIDLLLIAIMAKLFQAFELSRDSS